MAVEKGRRHVPFGGLEWRMRKMAARYDWETIRAEYEAGASQSDLSRRHGPSRTAIQKRIRAEGWIQDVSGTINRLAEAKVAGVIAGCTPQKKAEALDRAADAKAAVMVRHKEEWVQHQRIIDEALAADDFDKAKLAKITAETLKIRQEGERKAWGIKETSEETRRVTDVSVVVDLSHADSAQIAALVDAAYSEADHG